MNGEFICRSVKRNNGIKQVHLVRDDTRSQPENILLDTLSDEFVMGRKYLVQVTPLVGERG